MSRLTRMQIELYTQAGHNTLQTGMISLMGWPHCSAASRACQLCHWLGVMQ